MSRFGWISLVFFLMTSAFAQEVNPDSYLTPTTQDVSIQYLTQIFGGVGSVLLGPSTIIGSIFDVFNLGIMVVAGFMLAYIISFNLFNEVASGQPLAQQYDFWMVGRVVLGNSFILPSYDGYSYIQVIVMQCAVYGVGLADSVWHAAIDNLNIYENSSSAEISDESGIVNKDIIGDDNTQASNSNIVSKDATVAVLWQMSVCAQTQYQHALMLGHSPNFSDYSWRLNGNVAQTGINVNGQDCGQVVLDTQGLSATQAAIAQSSFYNTVMGLQGYAQSLYNSTLSQPAGKWYDVLMCAPNGQSSDCQQGVQLAQIGSTYYGTLKPYATKPADDEAQNNGNDDEVESLEKQGWASASFYILSVAAQQSDDPEQSSDQFDENTLTSMLYKVSKPIGYTSHTEDAYNDVSQIYWILSTCSDAQNCGQSPYGISDGKTTKMNWAVTDTAYIAKAQSVISDSYETSTSEGITCTSNRYLDVAVAALYQNWLKNDKGQGNFKQMNLDQKSIIFNQGASGGFGDVYVGFNQRNLFVLLNKVMSDITGIRYFSNMSQKSYDGLNHNKEIDAINKCKIGDTTGCFCQVVTDPKLVTQGRGIMGSYQGHMTASGQVIPSDPMMIIRNMGIDIFTHGIDTITQSIHDQLDTTITLAGEYFGLSALITSSFAPVIIYMGSFPTVSTVIALTSTAIKVFSSVFTFFQLWDFQQMQMYRGALSTFTSIIPVTGFLLGVYIPFIPTFYYVFSVLGWFIAVIEAMVAAPIIALGMTYPKGHDLLGASEQGLILLLQLFCRPVSIVFGLMAGMLVSSVIFQMLNYMMIGFLAGYAASFSALSGDSTGVLVGIALVVLVYMYIAVVLMSNSYSLIYRLPDRVLRWIGAPMDPQGVAEMVNEVRRGATDALSKGMQSGARSSGEVSTPGSARLNVMSPIQGVDPD